MSDLFKRNLGDESQTIPQCAFLKSIPQQTANNEHQDDELQVLHEDTGHKLPLGLSEVLSTDSSFIDKNGIAFAKGNAVPPDLPPESTAHHARDAEISPLRRNTSLPPPAKRQKRTAENLRASLSSSGTAILPSEPHHQVGQPPESTASSKNHSKSSTKSDLENLQGNSEITSGKLPSTAVADNSSSPDTITVDISSEGPHGRRSRTKSKSDLERLPSEPAIILGSAMENRVEYESILTSLGARMVNMVSEADVLCVRKGELRKTPKLILGIIHGKFIVSETWIRACERSKSFVDPTNHIPKDPIKQAEWGFNLEQAIDRGRQLSDGNTSRLLVGWTIFTTSQLRAELGTRMSDLKTIANAMGAKFKSQLPSSRALPNSLVLGGSRDNYAREVHDLGYDLFSRQALLTAALRGNLDISSEEFKIQPLIKEESPE